jgi:ligand-binding sensor domain-containing protein
VSSGRPGQDSIRSVAVSEVAAEMLEKAQMMDEGYLAVDGLSEKQVDEYFRQADVGNDGRVAGHEAMRFFLKSGLASSLLSKIWQRAKPPEIVSLAPEGLDKHQFSLALRLVAFAQQSYDLDNEQMVLAAMDPELWASMGYPPLRPPLFTEENMTHSEVQESSPRRSRSPIRPAGARNLHKTAGGSSTEFRPLPYEVRYPPLHANESAKLSDIMSVDGFLMAYPSFENGLMVWGSAESKIVDIETEHSRSLLRLTVQKERTHTKCKTEDDDAAQCVEISHITYKNRKISCCLLDKNRRILWVADKDGWISGYTVANINAKAMAKEHLIHQWRACRVGFVTSMTVALNNELWTGNSRGVIRVWPHTAGTPTVMSIFNPFSGESDMKGRELRKSTFDKAHSSKVIALHTAANGYTIWSVSKKSILLWDAGSGVCFGSIGSESNNSSVRPNFFQEASSTAIIDKNHGMELDPLTGSVLWRPAREDYGYCHTQQESWASMSERGVVELTERITDGAGKAVSFIGRLGVKMKTGSTKGSASLSKYDEASLDSYTVSNAHHNTILSNIFTMIAPHDDTMWVGHLDGTIHVYTSAGKVIDQISLGAHITCMAEIAREVWVGTGNGEVFRILTNNRSILGKFRAHKSSLKSITQTGVRAFTLAADGSISGWGIGQDSDRLRACWYVKLWFRA